MGITIFRKPDSGHITCSCGLDFSLDTNKEGDAAGIFRRREGIFPIEGTEGIVNSLLSDTATMSSTYSIANSRR